MVGFSSLICLLEYRICGLVFEVTNLIFWGTLKIVHGTFWPVSASGRGHCRSLARRRSTGSPKRAPPCRPHRHCRALARARAHARTRTPRSVSLAALLPRARLLGTVRVWPHVGLPRLPCHDIRAQCDTTLLPLPWPAPSTVVQRAEPPLSC